ncbi:MAG: hypothetical protein R3E12_12500 [Candidatus Eisenbacteria bacterium]|uniref:Uncharacterized protein n=1 Tax=Eiseniibacteriota bacterium TaxID=2212470 RepID=A0A956RNF2_UNCEI|nr:hypothetical protein [Candidatus Eisenbacteria bacterium]
MPLHESIARTLARLRESRAAIALAVPVVTLCGSYLYLTRLHGTWRLFSSVVHEDGRRTLLQTIFYFEHFLREVPVSAFLAIAVALLVYDADAEGLREVQPSPSQRKRGNETTSVGVRTPGFAEAKCSNRPPSSAEESNSSASTFAARGVFVWLGMAAILFATAVVMTGRRYGFAEVGRELLQFRTRGDTLRFGSHWHYHLLQLPFVFGLSWTIARVARSSPRVGDVGRFGRRSGWSTMWWTAVLALTLSFRPGPAFLTDPVYLAHQLREMWTSLTLTLPLALGVLWFLERRTARSASRALPRLAPAGCPAPDSASAGDPPNRISDRGRFSREWQTWVPGLVAAGVAGGTFLRLQGQDIGALAQKPAGVAELLASHSFEHALDGVWLALVAGAVYRGRATVAARATASRTARRASSGLPN